MNRALLLADRLGPALPAATLAAGIALMLLPTGLGTGGAWPHWPMLAVLVWAALRPGRMTPGLAFVGGLALDALAGLPLGVHAATFALVVVAVRLLDRQARGLNLALDFGAAALLVLAAHGLIAAFVALAGQTAPLLAMALQALVTCLALPLAIHLAAQVQRGLGGPA